MLATSILPLLCLGWSPRKRLPSAIEEPFKLSKLSEERSKPSVRATFEILNPFVLSFTSLGRKKETRWNPLNVSQNSDQMEWWNLSLSNSFSINRFSISSILLHSTLSRVERGKEATEYTEGTKIPSI